MSNRSPKNHLNLTLPSPSMEDNHILISSESDNGTPINIIDPSKDKTKSQSGTENSPKLDSNLDLANFTKQFSPNIQHNKVIWESSKKFKDFEKLIINQNITNHQKDQLLKFLKIKTDIGDASVDDIIELEELGKGNGGVVSKVQHKPTNEIMARKNIYLEVKPSSRTQIIRELQILHECQSPYIVGYFGCYPFEVEVSLYMKYMDGGSLDILLQKAGRFPEPIISEITLPVLKGLLYLRNNHHIIHRNLKPSNILVNKNGEVKICDFGVSNRLIDLMVSSYITTHSYMAPERLIGEQYTSLSDVWSLGLSLTEFAIGIYPIPSVGPENFLHSFSVNRADNFLEHLKAAVQGRPLRPIQCSDKCPMAVFELLSHLVDYPPPSLPEFCFSTNFLSFINHCLRKEAIERLSLEMLEKHRFINENSVAHLLTNLKYEQKLDFDHHNDHLIGNYVTNMLNSN